MEFSLKSSLVLNLYIITFIINTSDLVDCGYQYGQLDGEKYVAHRILLANVTSIYIPFSFKNNPLNTFKLCDLKYGSATIDDKINYQFKVCGTNQQCKEYNKDRIKQCKCGYKIDRDCNGSRNILLKCLKSLIPV